MVTSLVSWVLLPSFSCDDANNCPSSNNRGWRYVIASLSALTVLMILSRRFVLEYYESPKNLIVRGKPKEAVTILKKLAELNGKTLDITEQDFNKEDILEGEEESASGYALLFSKGMYVTTCMVIFIWVFVGVGYDFVLNKLLGTIYSTEFFQSFWKTAELRKRNFLYQKHIEII